MFVFNCCVVCLMLATIFLFFSVGKFSQSWYHYCEKLIFENLESLSLGNSKCSFCFVALFFCLSPRRYLKSFIDFSHVLWRNTNFYSKSSEVGFIMNSWIKSLLLQTIDLRFSFHLDHSPIWLIEAIWKYACCEKGGGLLTSFKTWHDFYLIGTQLTQSLKSQELVLTRSEK